jgi:hypothetical protein
LIERDLFGNRSGPFRIMPGSVRGVLDHGRNSQ